MDAEYIAGGESMKERIIEVIQEMTKDIWDDNQCDMLTSIIDEIAEL
tara:strand:+ start:219 stop:359 length:141 start_codon:yes stop_codon:yes gene_type:complete